MALTDYNTECGSLPLSLVQMLASTVRGYHDIQGVIHYRLNGIVSEGNCSGLTDPLDCDLSHIESERLLVENVFNFDECGNLAIKVFSNSDNNWEDYEACGEMPLTLIQMLARTIRTYESFNRVNAVLETVACANLTTMYQCDSFSLTKEVAEELLVANVFAVDDCGNLLVKLIADSNTMTDYNTGCSEEPLSFLQLLAMCIVQYEGHYYINTAVVSGDCDDLHAFWTCDNGHLDPARVLVENLFATDSCGNFAIKLFSNQGKAE
jgi:hypothetical protein